MDSTIDLLLLTPAEMAAADAAATASGIDSFQLMQRAGQAVAAAALRHFPHTLRHVVLCGPGNNGGDGYVAARTLAQSGARVAVFHFGDPERLAGDAAMARHRWGGVSAPLDSFSPQAGDLVIDALFGAGLGRDVPEAVADVIAAVSQARLPVIAVDLPSGLCGRRGVALGAAFRATLSVTFMALKPGHLLMPGRALCGAVECFDIGIPARIVTAAAGGLRRNHPRLWLHALPMADGGAHKYQRGHLAVFSGPHSRTGAARLAAGAGLKAGAGLVTIASPGDALAVNAGALTAVMLKRVDNGEDLRHFIDDARLSAFVLGPGFGIGEKARQFVSLLRERPLVLDADGISAFRDDPAALFEMLSAGPTRLVLTPHDGEFARLFPDLAGDSDLGKVERAVEAARRAQAVIVLKGADTVIASPDGRAYINANAPPWLASAGSGDVLAGIIGALLARGMPAFKAACAGVWLHGEAGDRAGEGLTAETLAACVLPRPAG